MASSSNRKRVALIFAATGRYATEFAPQYVATARTHFVQSAHVDIFAMSDVAIPDCHCISVPHGSWPGPSIQRWEWILERRALFQSYDYLYLTDVDLYFQAPVTEEIFSDGVVAVIHPVFRGGPGTPERNPESSGYIPHKARHRYYYAAFQGGATTVYLDAAEQCRRLLQEDQKRGMMAIWHDESYWNRYLWKNPPALALGPNFLWWEGRRGKNPSASIVLIEKKRTDLRD